MDLQQAIKNDYNKIINEVGIPVSFRDKQSGQIFETSGIVTRRTQTYIPMSGISEPLPICAVTVSENGFDFVIPLSVRDIEISWIDMSGIRVSRIASEISKDYSLGRITFLCMMEYL